MFNFNHTAISVENLQKSIDFYEKFGFKIKKQYNSPDVDIIHLENGDQVLEVFYYKDASPLPEHAKNLGVDLKTIGTKHFGLGVENISDAKSFIENQKLYDGEIQITQGRLGKPYFFIPDPNGILIEIIER